jgi:hypothetical protein
VFNNIFSGDLNMAKAATKPQSSFNEEEFEQKIALGVKNMLEEMSTTIDMKLEESNTINNNAIQALTAVIDQVGKQSSVPNIEAFMKSEKIAGSMNRVDLYKMTFEAICGGVMSGAMNPLTRFVGTKEDVESAKVEFDKIINLTDIAIERFESRYKLEAHEEFNPT